jgi:drug/metabolite transporter (DMT)-like permease
VSYLAAAIAALCFGLGTVLEATAARRSEASTGIDPKLLVGLLRQPAFLGSMTATVFGVGASYVAYRDLPIFVVQAALASAVGIATVISAFAHDEPITGQVRLGIGAIIGGIALLAVSSGEQSAPDPSLGFRIGLLAAAVAFVGVALVVGRRPGGSSVDVALLGVTAGLLFGASNVGLRVMRGFAPLDLLGDPAAWATGLGGVGGILVLATALQRGSVALAAGSVTTSETVVPALIGILLLDERPRPGWALPAALGFVVAVAGAVVLSREAEIHGDAEPVASGVEARPEPG